MAGMKAFVFLVILSRLKSSSRARDKSCDGFLAGSLNEYFGEAEYQQLIEVTARDLNECSRSSYATPFGTLGWLPKASSVVGFQLITKSKPAANFWPAR